MNTAADSELPSYRDVAPGDAPWCLEAAEHFFGKTMEEAEALFGSGAGLSYTEDLFWMAPAGFRFYVQAAIRWCLSPRANGDPDIINGVAGAISLWRDSEPEELVPCAGLLAKFCLEVLDSFDRYDADPEIYSGLRERYQELGDYFTRILNGRNG